MNTAVPPAPMEWHPAYRGQTWLLDWLESTDPTVHLAVDKPMRLADFTADQPLSAPAMRTLTLTKRKAHGPAPWTERPYFYMWLCAVDDLGRSIAGEARPQYLEVKPWERP